MPSSRNLLVILASGMRADAYGRAGVWPLQTPHLDALAVGGLDLVGISPSPLSIPALLSLYSGLHPRQHGVLDQPGTIPNITEGWPGRLREAGYYLAGAGRVDAIAGHLHDACCVSDLSQLRDANCAYLRHAARKGLLLRVQAQREQRAKVGVFDSSAQRLEDPEQDVDGFIVEQAMEMIQRLPTDRPWAMVVAFTGPGNDLPAPQAMRDLINANELVHGYSPPNLAGAGDYLEPDQPWSYLQTLTLERVRHIRAEYLARTLMIDQSVGLLLKGLEKHNRLERTWSVFASDHGKLLGEQGFFGHKSFLGGAIWTPFWVKPPEGFGGRTRERQADSEGLVSMVDVAATICAIAGADAPRGSVGKSVLPALAGQPIGADAVIAEYSDRLMLETLEHKLGLDVSTGHPRMLFDLVNDPDERKNLAGTIEAENVLDELRARLGDLLLPMRPIAI